MVVIRPFSVQRPQFKLWASFVALLWQLNDEMERDVTLPHEFYVIDLAGEMERGVTLPHSCYWPGWRDETWCYIATFMLLTWLARWDVVLHCHIHAIDLAGEMERGVTLPHLCYCPGWREGTWCYIATFMLLTWLARWDVVLHCHIYAIDLAGEVERGVQNDHCILVVIRPFNVQRSQFKLWASFVALLWQLNDEMGRGVTLPHEFYVIDLAGEMGRGVTLPHLCYWPGWRDGTWRYIATFMLLSWLTRQNVMLHDNIVITEVDDETERDVILPHWTWCRVTTWNVMFYHMERDVMLTRGMWCRVTTWKVMLLPHGTWCRVTTWHVMLCYRMEPDIILPHGTWYRVTT